MMMICVENIKNCLRIFEGHKSIKMLRISDLCVSGSYNKSVYIVHIPWKVVDDFKDLLLQSTSELSAKANAKDFPESIKKKEKEKMLHEKIVFPGEKKIKKQQFTIYTYIKSHSIVWNKYGSHFFHPNIFPFIWHFFVSILHPPAHNSHQPIIAQKNKFIVQKHIKWIRKSHVWNK